MGLIKNTGFNSIPEIMNDFNKSFNVDYSGFSNSFKGFNAPEINSIFPANFSQPINMNNFSINSWTPLNQFNTFMGNSNTFINFDTFTPQTLPQQPTFKFDFNQYSIGTYYSNKTSSSAGSSRIASKTITRRSSNPSSLQLSLVDNAKYYVGRVNSDSEGNRLFSNGVQQAWCADFVTQVARDTFGTALPSDFGSSAVSGLRSWAQNNDCYTEVPSSNKADFIRENVKPGDIMIEKKNGKSHTGIVTKVNDDGSFETVEGNCSNSVTTRTYAANSPTLSGFISLEQYA